MAFQFILFFVLHIFLYLNIVTVPHSLFELLILFFLESIVLLALLARYGHELGHGSIFKNKKLNHFFYVFCFESFGIDTFLWKFTHNMIHHPLPNIVGYDGDINGNNLLRMGPHEKHVLKQKYMHLYAPFLYSLFFLNKFFVKDFKTLKKIGVDFIKDKKRTQLQLLIMISKKSFYLFMMIGLPILFLDYNFFQVFSVFIIFQMIFSIFIGFVLGGSHSSIHNIFYQPDLNGNVENSYCVHQVITAVDFHAQSKFFNLVFGSTNAHVAHHIYPTMSSEHYPVVSKFIKELAKKYQIKYTDLNFAQYCIDHWKYLRESAHNSEKFLSSLRKYEKVNLE